MQQNKCYQWYRDLGMKNSQPIVILFGGMGNRLFQLARAWDLKQRGYFPKVIDIENFSLAYFLISKILKWTRHPMWIDLATVCGTANLDYARPNLMIRIKFYFAVMTLLISDRKKKFNAELHKDTRSIQLGYFQASNCITSDSVIAISQAVFTTLNLQHLQRNSAIVHIRGGDFAVKDRLSKDVVSHFVKENPSACCVTNDPCYVELEYPNLKICNSLDAKEDFIKLTNSQNILPSNSTFCFWACSIAIISHSAVLWSVPADEYWNYIHKVAES